MSGTRRPRNLVLGIARLARFRAEGFAEFGDTPQDFLNSLAPLAGFAIVATVLRVATGDAPAALAELLMTMVALLTPPVIAHLFARRWGREAAWLRYATAFTWCHWVVFAAFALLLILVTGALSAFGMVPDVAIAVAELCWAAYGLAMHWFIARRGLDLARWQASLLLAAVELGTGLLVAGPLLIGGYGLPMMSGE